MHSSLQELLDFMKVGFPKIQDKILIKILFTLKGRDKQYKNIGFSRLEASNFNMSEGTLQKIIYFLRNNGIIELIGQSKTKKQYDYQKCNIYKLCDNFKQLFYDIETFTKKVFTYINPLEFMKKYFSYKFKNGIYNFKVNGQKYIIQTKGSFAGVIYATLDNKIINPLSLL